MQQRFAQISDPHLTTLDNVLVTELDVVAPHTIESAVAAGIERFGASCHRLRGAALSTPTSTPTLIYF